jgi:hypothetical protein
VPLTADVVKIIKAQCLDGEPESSSHVFAHYGESVKDRAKKAGAALSHVLEFEFRGHDLRRTAATRMAEAGVPRQHISAVLNHIEAGPAATRVYDRYSYDAEKRAALETWAKALSRILAEKPKARHRRGNKKARLSAVRQEHSRAHSERDRREIEGSALAQRRPGNLGGPAAA